MVKRCLDSVLNQTFVPLEIIIVDQNDHPQLEGFKSLQVKYVHYPDRRISSARNQGAHHAKAEWLWFLDDDAFSSKNFLANFEKIIKKNLYLDVIAGSILIENTNAYYSVRHSIGGSLSSLTGSKLLMGGNFLIRKKVFQELGAFDEYFGIGSTIPSSEDTDLVWRAIFNHKIMSYESSLAVYHPAPQEMSKEKAYAYAIGKGALVRKWIFKKFSKIIWYELFEMLIVPLIKTLKSPKNFTLNFSIFRGRLKGLLNTL